MKRAAKTQKKRNKRGVKSLFLWSIVVILMVAAYPQSPLYTSNQNQYFLHGMAEAGLGSLDQDWLASTKEPTPVFTFLIKWTFLLLKSEILFYVYFAVLIGIYFLALLGILDEIYDLKGSKIKFLITALLLISFHSAAFRFLISNNIGVEWGYLLDGGFSGQKLLGFIYQPSVFGVLLIVSLYLFIVGKPYLAVFTAAITANIHPTYLLSAALLTGGYICASHLEDKKSKKPIWIGLTALITVTPIMVYVFRNFWGGIETAEAYRILTDIRIPHHAVIREWFGLVSIIKILIIIVGLAVIKKQQKLFIPLVVVSSLSFVLSIIQYIFDSDFLALIFPWRPSVLLVPVCSAVIYGAIAARMGDIKWILEKKKAVSVLCSILFASLAAAGIIRLGILIDKKMTTPEAGLFAWIRETSTDSDKYLIPIGMESFRIATLRPAYIDYFSIPYGVEDVITWYHRVLAANKFYDGECGELMYMQNDDRITYVINKKENLQPDCENYSLVYEDDLYLAYQINK
jgi:hypothetical protein